MKKNIIAVLCLVWLSFPSCVKNKDTSSLPSKVAMSINDHNWQSDTILLYQSGEITISFSFAKGIHNPNHQDNAGIAYDEVLHFSFIKKIKGKQMLNLPYYMQPENSDRYLPTTKFITYVDQGCVTCQGYYIDSTRMEENWVEIDRQKNNYQKVWGRFNLVLINRNLVDGCKETGYPDTLYIKSQEFYLEYLN